MHPDELKNGVQVAKHGVRSPIHCRKLVWEMDMIRFRIGLVTPIARMRLTVELDVGSVGQFPIVVEHVNMPLCYLFCHIEFLPVLQNYRLSDCRSG